MSKRKSNAHASINGEIVFATRREFEDGNGLNTYIVRAVDEIEKDGKLFTTKQSIICKQFEKDLLEFEKGDVVVVEGFLRENRYKDEESGLWKSKGLEVIIYSIYKVDENPKEDPDLPF